MVLKKCKVLCIGDSLALPGHLNSYEDTWFFKLKKEFPKHDFVSFFKRQLTTEALVTMGGGKDGIDNWPKGGDCLEAFMPDIVILQLGIVDCAPRLLNKYERRIISLIPLGMRSSFIMLVKKYKKRSTKNTTVSLQNFKNNLDNYLYRAEKIAKKIIIIPISIPDSTFLAKNKEALINVETYNNYYFDLALKKYDVVCTTVLSPNISVNSVYQDGYHPNQLGHNFIFQELKRIISGLN